MVKSHVALVTVTYGNRIHLLRETVRRAFDAGVEQAVVVVNGCEDHIVESIREILTERHGGAVSIIVETSNTGSAGGFHDGLAAARNLDGIDRVWLLDDDNWTESGTLATALGHARRLESQYGDARVAVVCYRHYLLPHRRIRDGVSPAVAYPRPGSALRFDLRTRFRRDHVRGPARDPSQPVQVPLAPYGGILMQTATIRNHALPRRDYVLYADDYEYTYRLCSGGVTFFLLPDATVADVESPQLAPDAPRGLVRLLRTPKSQQAKLYYQLRNDLHLDLERARTMSERLILGGNLAFYLVAVVAFAARDGRNRSAATVVFRAVRDGLTGRLGMTYAL